MPPLSKKKQIAAGALSALLLVVAFPPYSVWGIGFVGLVPFFLALFRARSYRDAFRVGMACSIVFILAGFHWVSYVAIHFGNLPWIVGQLVLILFSLFGEAQYLLFALFAFAVLRRTREVAPWQRALVLFLFLPLAYVGMDFLYPKIFPATLGHTLYGWFSVAQVAEYVGAFGLTWPILAGNVAAAVIVHDLLQRRRVARSALATLGLLAAALGALHVWGAARVSELARQEEGYSREFRVSLLQGNIGDIEKLASERGYYPALKQVLETYRSMSLETVRRFRPDLVIWPETAYPMLYTDFKDPGANRSGTAKDQWVADVLKEMGTPLLFGGYSSKGGRDFNSAFFLVPDGTERPRLAGLYRKVILLPFGEYVPLGPLGPLIQDVVPTIADFGRGQGPVVFEMPGLGFKLAPQICYEGIVAEHARGAGVQGADVILNLTNDSWFGKTTEPWLHLVLTAFRSIELRRPLIRSTNTGFTTVIAMTGEMRWKTRLFEQDTLEAVLRLPAAGQSFPATFYLAHGEVFAKSAAAVFAGGALGLLGPGVLAAIRRRRRSRR